MIFDALSFSLFFSPPSSMDVIASQPLSDATDTQCQAGSSKQFFPVSYASKRRLPRHPRQWLPWAASCLFFLFLLAKVHLRMPSSGHDSHIDMDVAVISFSVNFLFFFCLCGFFFSFVGTGRAQHTRPNTPNISLAPGLDSHILGDGTPNHLRICNSILCITAAVAFSYYMPDFLHSELDIPPIGLMQRS